MAGTIEFGGRGGLAGGTTIGGAEDTGVTAGVEVSAAGVTAGDEGVVDVAADVVVDDEPAMVSHHGSVVSLDAVSLDEQEASDPIVSAAAVRSVPWRLARAAADWLLIPAFIATPSIVRPGPSPPAVVAAPSTPRCVRQRSRAVRRHVGR